jgi:putative chitinase
MRFKGVDAIQMTGRANYQAFANYIKDQRVMDGWQYVAQHYLFLPSAFWWYLNDMNTLANSGASVREITRRVNGGYNGLADRERYYRRALNVI